ncbi:MAG: hypothetical protein H0W06_04830 [Chloroflexia bacterium]|nr:hypothetical protein [Chloroflexia bacterium]
MEAIAAIMILVALGALALRFGHDSRDTPHSAEHRFAARGVTWTNTYALRADRSAIPASQPTGSVIVLAAGEAEWDRPLVASVDAVTESPRRPTLEFIDRGLPASATPFRGAANADLLELHARALVAAYWSETTWLTGLVSATAFQRVVDELDRLRIGRATEDTPVVSIRTAASDLPRVDAAPAIMPVAS